MRRAAGYDRRRFLGAAAITIAAAHLGMTGCAKAQSGTSLLFVEQRLYQLIRQAGPIADHQFEIEFLDSGAQVFNFTFG